MLIKARSGVVYVSLCVGCWVCFWCSTRSLTIHGLTLSSKGITGCWKGILKIVDCDGSAGSGESCDSCESCGSCGATARRAEARLWCWQRSVPFLYKNCTEPKLNLQILNTKRWQKPLTIWKISKNAFTL